ncbi:hypothetical protein EC968_004639 [Mortierella alpina]|nr:hypothetical protein EC968_004639 [Mortierella alpina]
MHTVNSLFRSTYSQIVQSDKRWESRLPLDTVAIGWYSLVFCVSFDKLDVNFLESITFDVQQSDSEQRDVLDTSTTTSVNKGDIELLPKNGRVMIRLHQQTNVQSGAKYLFPSIVIKTTPGAVPNQSVELHHIELETKSITPYDDVEGPVHILYGEDKPDQFIKVGEDKPDQLITGPVKICAYAISDMGTYVATLYLVKDMAYLDIWDILKQNDNSHPGRPQSITMPYAHKSFQLGDQLGIAGLKFDVAISNTGLQAAVCSLEESGRVVIPFSVYSCVPVTAADHHLGRPWTLYKPLLSRTRFKGAFGHIAFRTINSSIGPKNIETKDERFFKFDGFTFQVYKASGYWRRLLSITATSGIPKAIMAETLFHSIRRRFFAYAGTKNFVTIWDFEARKIVSRIFVPEDTNPVRASLSRDGSLVAIAVKGVIHVHDVQSGILLDSLGNDLIETNDFEMDFVQDYLTTLTFATSTIECGHRPKTRSVVRVRDMSIVDTYEIQPKYRLQTPQVIEAPIFAFDQGAILNIVKKKCHSPPEDIPWHLDCSAEVTTQIHRFHNNQVDIIALDGTKFKIIASAAIPTSPKLTIEAKGALGATIKTATISVGEVQYPFQGFYLKELSQLFILSGCYLHVWKLSATGESICELAYIWKLHPDEPPRSVNCDPPQHTGNRDSPQHTVNCDSPQPSEVYDHQLQDAEDYIDPQHEDYNDSQYTGDYDDPQYIEDYDDPQHVEDADDPQNTEEYDDLQNSDDKTYRKLLSVETCEHGKTAYIILSPAQEIHHGGNLSEDAPRGEEEIVCVPISPKATVKMTEAIRLVSGVQHLTSIYAKSDFNVQESILRYFMTCIRPSSKHSESVLTSLCRAWSPQNDSYIKGIFSKLLPLERVTWIPRMSSSEGQNPLRTLLFKIRQAPKVFGLVKIFTDYCASQAVRTGDTSFLVSIFASMPRLMKLLPEHATEFLRKVSYIPVTQSAFILDNHIIVHPPKVFLKFWKKKTSLAKTKYPILQLNHIQSSPNLKNNTFRRPLYIASFNMLWNYKDNIKAKTNGPNTCWKTLYHVLTLKLRLRSHRFVECHNFNLMVFDNPAITALVAYKWNTIGFWYWSFRFTFQLIFYILVIAAALLQVFRDELHKAHITAVFASIIIFGVAFLWLELLQAIKHGKRYRTVYNLLDVMGYTVPVGTSIQQLVVLYKNDPSGYTKTVGFAVLVVFLHILFELRVFKSVCRTVSIIQHTVVEIRAFFFIFAAGIVAFTITALHLLRACPVLDGCKALTTKFSGDFLGALSSIYFLMGGRYNDVDDEFDSETWEFHLMMAVYFFFTVIVMLNVLIALINSAISKSDDSWRLTWIESRLRYIESAENMSYHIYGFRQSHNYWFPKKIYYSATWEEVKAHREKYPSEKYKAKDRVWERDEEDEIEGSATNSTVTVANARSSQQPTFRSDALSDTGGRVNHGYSEDDHSHDIIEQDVKYQLKTLQQQLQQQQTKHADQLEQLSSRSQEQYQRMMEVLMEVQRQGGVDRQVENMVRER